MFGQFSMIRGSPQVNGSERFDSTQELYDFIFGKKGLRESIPGIERTETMLVLKSVKESGVLF